VAPVDVHVVSYGDADDLAPLIASLGRQTLAPARVRIWHNGPAFPLALPAPIEVSGDGGNNGFGAGHNRLLARPGSDIVVLANPDLELDPACLERLRAAFDDPDVVVGSALLVDREGRVNAFGLDLTADLLGVNVDRGRAPDAVAAEPTHDHLAPTGGLFAVHRARLARRTAGSFEVRALFPESLFLYLEDVALGLKLRAAGARIAFAPEARAVHRWSASTGARSALKLYHVERNRLWLARALLGDVAAVGALPVTALRYASYALGAVRAGRALGDARAGGLMRALLRGVAHGLGRPVPDELRRYLAGVRLPLSLLRRYLAPWRVQLGDPTA
jgi:GT2 family glycosyltransferase